MSEDGREESPGTREGRYANYFSVGHTAHEFLLECGQVFQEEHDAHVYVRIVTSPLYAKALLKTLDVSVRQFEAEFGPVPDLDGEGPR